MSFAKFWAGILLLAFGISGGIVGRSQAAPPSQIEPYTVIVGDIGDAYNVGCMVGWPQWTEIDDQQTAVFCEGTEVSTQPDVAEDGGAWTHYADIFVPTKSGIILMCDASPGPTTWRGPEEDEGAVTVACVEAPGGAPTPATFPPTATPTAVPSPTSTATPVATPTGATVIVQPGDDIRTAVGNAPTGATILLRGGDYNVGTGSHYQLTMTGKTLASYPGEEARINGLIQFSLTNATVRNLAFRWAGGSSSAHMVKLAGGTGWLFQDNEVSGAESYACILVSGSPVDWTLRGNNVHDCVGGNGDPNQNHGIYVNAPGSVNGLIENNRIYNAPMGRGLKLGPASSGSQGPQNITVRGNLIDTSTRSSISISGGNVHSLVIEDNTFRNSAESAIRFYQATNGAGTVIQNNRYSGVPAFCKDGDSTLKCAAVVGSGNAPE